MGTYVYAVSKTQSKSARLATGEKVRVNRLTYQYKASWNFWTWRADNALGNGRIANMERAWGAERPTHIALELTDGAPVYAWTSEGISWTDTNPLPAEKIGTLRCSAGGRWTVEPPGPRASGSHGKHGRSPFWLLKSWPFTHRCSRMMLCQRTTFRAPCARISNSKPVRNATAPGGLSVTDALSWFTPGIGLRLRT